MKAEVSKIRVVAAWTWNAADEQCGICYNPFDGCCPQCTVPGTACPTVWGGVCKHPFHLHCIAKWVGAQQPDAQKCPMCRQDWTFPDAA